jgi:hypothetical protein
MRNKQSNLLWLKDMIEHLTTCQEQLEWSDDADTVQMLTDTMLRDLDCCRRLCETLRRQREPQFAA